MWEFEEDKWDRLDRDAEQMLRRFDLDDATEGLIEELGDLTEEPSHQ